MALIPRISYNPHRNVTTVASQQLETVLADCAAEMDALYARCIEVAPNFGVQLDDLKAVLRAAVEKYLVDREAGVVPSPAEVRTFFSELQVHDLFLAQACANGNERAWWEFDQNFKRYIERIARHMASAEYDADEVIDSVYVELYGTRVVDGVRLSKFATYTGRGSLRGWLRTVVWHAVIDLHRAKHDEISLDEWTESGGEAHTRPEHSSTRKEGEGPMIESIARQRYRTATVAALDVALRSLEDHEKLLLLYYHVENLKLREIARLVEAPASPLRMWFQRRSKQRDAVPESRVHESTVMRWLEKVYGKALGTFRTEVETTHRLGKEEIELCLSMATEDLATLDIRRHLFDVAPEYIEEIKESLSKAKGDEPSA